MKKEIFEELKLPEFINGLDCKNPLYMINNTTPELVETYRMFQKLYYNISCARYSLAQAYEEDHAKDFPSSDGVMWFRCLNCNNAILWYNSCIDLLLQTIWIYEELYSEELSEKESQMRNKRKVYSGITTGKYSKILRECKLETINSINTKKQLPYIDKINTFTDSFKQVKNWANALKHRNGINYKQLYVDSRVGLVVMDKEWERDITKKCPFEGKQTYNSSSTIKLEDLDKIILTLKSYHIEIYTLIESVFNDLDMPKSNM